MTEYSRNPVTHTVCFSEEVLKACSGFTAHNQLPENGHSDLDKRKNAQEQVAASIGD